MSTSYLPDNPQSYMPRIVWRNPIDRPHSVLGDIHGTYPAEQFWLWTSQTTDDAARVPDPRFPVRLVIMRRDFDSDRRFHTICWVPDVETGKRAAREFLDRVDAGERPEDVIPLNGQVRA